MVVFTTSFGQQQINKTLFFDGQNRSYIVYIPASYNANSSTPILFNFHGGGGTSSSCVGKKSLVTHTSIISSRKYYPFCSQHKAYINSCLYVLLDPCQDCGEKTFSCGAWVYALKPSSSIYSK